MWSWCDLSLLFAFLTFRCNSGYFWYSFPLCVVAYAEDVGNCIATCTFAWMSSLDVVCENLKQLGSVCALFSSCTHESSAYSMMLGTPVRGSTHMDTMLCICVCGRVCVLLSADSRQYNHGRCASHFCLQFCFSCLMGIFPTSVWAHFFLCRSILSVVCILSHSHLLMNGCVCTLHCFNVISNLYGGNVMWYFSV